MEENKTKSVALRSDIGTQVIERIDSLCEAGFTMPKDYSYVNAIKMSLLTIQETKDKNGKTALDVCTPASVQKALFKMVTLGLNAGLKQCYFIVRGNQLCCDPSYFGNTLRMKRIYPTWEPIVVVIREGDTFELGINTDTGKKFVVKHEMKLENTDNDFVGAYMYLPNGSLYVMTKKQILTAWSQSSNKDLTVHKKFDEKMISKTVINMGCNLFINTHPETESILEDSDRFGLGLPYGQDAVIEALAKVNPRLAVVIVSGNAVAMPWVDNVNAIVEAWYCGSQSGTALADIIFGDVNPSGKLPVTFPVRLEDNGAHALGAYDPASTEAHYSEGIFVGYRWAQKKDIKPLFAFGHGLSYTTFSYSEAEISRTTMSENGKVTVSVNVTNTGDREGKEIVQLYIGDDECSVERPVMELKAFRKVSIKPGETVKVSFPVNADMLKFYGNDGWTLEKGSFTAYVGAASDDIRTSAKFNVK